MEIRAKFLGEPAVYLDGRLVETQHKKLYALFLYLLFHGNSSRDDIVVKFWGDFSPEDSKRNLRNALYNLKSIIGADVIVASGKNHLYINPEIIVRKDIDIFITENNEQQLLEQADLVFLDRFTLPRCPEFEDWQSGIRLIYEKMMVERLEKGLDGSKATGNAAKTEKFAEKLMQVDPYHEHAMESIMGLHLQKGRFNKAVLEYKIFTSRLRQELGVEPGEELQALYRKALGLDLKEPSGNILDGVRDTRMRESRLIQSEFQHFAASEPYKNCVLYGEPGSGKSKVLERFIKTGDAQWVFQIHFPRSGFQTPYHSISHILSALLTSGMLGEQRIPMDPGQSLYAAHLVLGQLKARRLKCVLVLHNLELVDLESWQVLMSTFFAGEQDGLFIAGEYSTGFEDSGLRLDGLRRLGGMQLLETPPLDIQQTREYLQSMMDDSNAADEYHKEVFGYTMGNLAFLGDVVAESNRARQLACSISDATRQRLREMAGSLSQEGMRVLEWLAVAGRGMSADHLRQAAGLPPHVLDSVMDSLFTRKLVQEQEEFGHLLLKIRWRQMREIVCGQMPAYRRASLHRTIGEAYENDFKTDPRDYFILQELKYHYGKTDLEFEKLLYAFAELEHILHYTDDFFPTFRVNETAYIQFSMDRHELYRRFREYGKQLESLEDILPVQRLNELKMRFHFMLGRTYNRDGQREKGIEHIREVIQLARTLDDRDYLVKGYLETVYYGVKRGDADLMEDYIAKLKEIPGVDRNALVQGITCRLEGLASLWKGDYTRSEVCLKKSIEIFNDPRLRGQNTINIAAAYDYIGYLYRNQGDYHKAEQNIAQAIELCESKKIRKSLDLFYEDLGYTYFLAGDYGKARETLETSLRFYDEMGTYWLRSVAESCMSMIELDQGNADKAIEHFRRAGIFSRKESVAEELEVLEMARARLREQKLLG